MKKRAKLLSFMLAAAMVVTTPAFPVMAAENQGNEETSNHSITLSDTEKTLGIGDTYTITATTSPEELFVDWESSDTEVATVDASSGLVTALKEGTATITAKLSVDTSCTATCTITVEGAAKNSCGDGVYYTLDNDGVLTISGDGTMTDFYSDWTAPDPGWSSNTSAVKKIVVEEGVKAISGAAFGFMYSYPNVTEIEIASTVETIGEYAFRGCGSDAGLTMTFAGNAPTIKTNGLPSKATTVKYNSDATGFDADAWTASNITLEKNLSPEEQAEQEKKEKLEKIEATVTADSQIEGAYALAPEKFTVNAYEAESYGYKDNVEDSVSTLDVLVAETEKMFGEDFTKDTATDYLAMYDSGWIYKIFNVETSACGFYVNDVAPSTTVDATAVSDGDRLTYFIYQDQSYWTDKYVVYEEGREITAVTASDVTLTVQGNSWGYISNLEGASVGYLSEDGTITKIGETDENGKITFTAPAVGSYTIVAYGEDVTESPLVMNTIKLSVVTDQDIVDKVIEAYEAMDVSSASLEDLKALQEKYDALTESQKDLFNADKTAAVTKNLVDTTVDYKELQADDTATKAELADAKNELAIAKAQLLKVSSFKVTAKKKAATLSWAKTSDAEGYQYAYRKSTVKSYKYVVTSSNKVTIKKLTKGKTYKFKVRTYKTVNGTKVYGAWTSVKKAKVK